MNLEPTALQGVYNLHAERHADGRGYFSEMHRRETFEAAAIEADFVQDNHSKSVRNTLRGLHYQNPNAQGKLIIVVQGGIYDVVVDIRKKAPTFKQWAAFELSEDNGAMLWIPPGYAHGFLALADDTHVIYKVTEYWDPRSERTICWDDAELGIDWPVAAPIMSEKDAAAPTLAENTSLPE